MELITPYAEIIYNTLSLRIEQSLYDVNRFIYSLSGSGRTESPSDESAPFA